MNITIRLNKNFTTAYNRLQAEYGTEIAKINGFADEQLSYNDFISNLLMKQQWQMLVLMAIQMFHIKIL